MELDCSRKPDSKYTSPPHQMQRGDEETMKNEANYTGIPSAHNLDKKGTQSCFMFDKLNFSSTK